MMGSQLICRSWVCAAICVGCPALAAAAIVDGSNGTGTANTTPPYPVAGLNNVGKLIFGPPGSGIYLGNQWVLTATHIGTVSAGTEFDVNGAAFFSDGNVVRLNNPSDNSPTDLEVFHLTADPGLPRLTLSGSTPAVGTSIFVTGFGLTRSANVQYYSVTGTGDATVWTPLPGPTGSNASGYTESTPNVMRWGTNLTNTPPGATGGAATEVINAGFGNVTVFASTFDTAGTSSEAQVSRGDSGGGVFDAGNVLVGMNDVAFTFQNQPADTAIFGDQSGFADIATYRSQIENITGVPEPSTVGWVLVGTVSVMARHRRRRSIRCNTAVPS
jgi:hypothetical protein